MRVEAELWAQAGVDMLCKPYRVADPPRIDLREAMTMIRASYGRGYCEAFREPDVGAHEQHARAVQLLVP